MRPRRAALACLLALLWPRGPAAGAPGAGPEPRGDATGAKAAGPGLGGREAARRAREEDEEVIRHLDELEELELLRHLHVLDPDLTEGPPPAEGAAGG